MCINNYRKNGFTRQQCILYRRVTDSVDLLYNRYKVHHYYIGVAVVVIRYNDDDYFKRNTRKTLLDFTNITYSCTTCIMRIQIENRYNYLVFTNLT